MRYVPCGPFPAWPQPPVLVLGQRWVCKMCRTQWSIRENPGQRRSRAGPPDLLSEAGRWQTVPEQDEAEDPEWGGVWGRDPFLNEQVEAQS